MFTEWLSQTVLLRTWLGNIMEGFKSAESKQSYGDVIDLQERRTTKELDNIFYRLFYRVDQACEVIKEALSRRDRKPSEK